jgi:hypothetical protein
MPERDRVQAHHTSSDGEVEDRDRPEPGSARDGGRLRRLSTPEWILAVLSALVLLTGIGELLVADWSWVRLTHVLSGAPVPGS